MAKILSNAGIVTGLPVEAEHVSQSINALTGVEAYDITISGSLVVNGLTYPFVDGAADLPILTDGAGNLSIRVLETVPTASYVSSSNVDGPHGFDSVISSSYAISSSHAIFSVLASSSLFSINALQAENSNTATSASYTLTASYALNGEDGKFAESSSYAVTASYVLGNITTPYKQAFSGSIVTINHNFDSEDIIVGVYQQSGSQTPAQIIPSSVLISDSNNVVLSFSNVVMGYAVITDGKGISSGTSAVSSSYAATASYAITASHEVVHEQSSSYAESSSYALTASYALNASGNSLTASYVSSSNVDGPHGMDSIISSSFAITASHALNSNSVTSSYALTASYLEGLIESASFATTASYVRMAEAYREDFTNVTSVSITHNIGSSDVIVAVYETTGGTTPQLIIPQSVTLTNDFEAVITFATNVTGYVIITDGKGVANIGLVTSASYANSASYAVTASYFEGSIDSASYAESASYALTAESASYATTAESASYVESASYAITASHVTNLPPGLVSGSSQVDRTWTLGANGSSDYTFTGPGLTGTENDPTIYLTRGETYRIINKMGAHPFRIQSTPNGSTGTPYNDGVTNNDVSNGTLIIDVQFDAPSILYYQCTSHASMGGIIYIIDTSNNTSYRETVTGTTSYSITHNLNEAYPLVQAYEQTSLAQEIPSSIVSTGVNSIDISFTNNFDGVIVVKK